ncbi:hypothetical protein HYV72_02375 [Candidatus Uhrbacteria bacterium]|nr:hypothetical protein [Candidatus Uhrbacteria bacterium]
MEGRAKLSGVCLGISGMDSLADQRAMLRALQKRPWWKNVDPSRRRVVNDVVIGFHAGTRSPEGIAIVSGTGSNGYAVNVKGEEAWVSGRGALMSDEGSGFAITTASLRAIRKHEDGRGERTMMTEILFHQFRIRATEELLPKLYGEWTKRDIAALHAIVDQAASRGDRIASRILDEAAEELLLMAHALHQKIVFETPRVDTVLFGGTILHSQELLARFLKKARHHAWLVPTVSENEPVEGALRLLGG